MNPHGTMLSFGLNATRFNTEATSFGGGVALYERDQFAGPLALELDANANASRLNVDRASAVFASGEFVPALQLGLGSVSMFLGARLAGGRMQQSASRPFFPGPGNGGSTSVTRSVSGTGPTFGADFTTYYFPDHKVRFGGRVDRMIIQGETYRDLTFSTEISDEAARFSAAIGRHAAGPATSTFGSGALELDIGNGGFAFNTSAGWFPPNPLTGALAGSYLNAGFSFKVAWRQPTIMPGPRARSAPSVAPGYLRF
jgi:hypothetical protein